MPNSMNKDEFNKKSAIACWGYEPLCMMCEESKADGELSMALYDMLEDMQLSCNDPRVCSQGCLDSAIESSMEG